MGKLIIKREKVMIGFAVKMKCYVNGKVICELKNGEEVSCEVSNEIIEFKCNTASNPMSDTVVLDMGNRDALHIFAKQGSWKALVSVLEDDAITEYSPPGITTVSLRWQAFLAFQKLPCPSE